MKRFHAVLSASILLTAFAAHGLSASELEQKAYNLLPPTSTSKTPLAIKCAALAKKENWPHSYVEGTFLSSNIFMIPGDCFDEPCPDRKGSLSANFKLIDGQDIWVGITGGTEKELVSASETFVKSQQYGMCIAVDARMLPQGVVKYNVVSPPIVIKS